MIPAANILVFQSNLQEIPHVSDVLDILMRGQGFSEEEILDTQLSVEEAVTNIILHGYQEKPGEISIKFSISDKALKIRIEDLAPAFDPLNVPDPDLSADVISRKIGSLGVFLMKKVMDELSYEYNEGKNILTLVKKKHTKH